MTTTIQRTEVFGKGMGNPTNAFQWLAMFREQADLTQQLIDTAPNAEPGTEAAIQEAIEKSIARQEELHHAWAMKSMILPDTARLPEGAGADASTWLDAYIRYSREWSPRAYDGFHEAIGLWVASTVAARRVVLRAGKDFYSSLYIALLGWSGFYAKTVTAGRGKALLSTAGLDWYLAPDDSTPRRFIADLAGRVPDGFDDLPLDEQAEVRKQLGFSAQRGWYSDEFGSFLDSMNSAGGIMAEFRGVLRSFDNHPKVYRVASFAHGDLKVKDPYLSLLASLTPADIAPFAARGSRLWGDGFWARFCFVAPGRDERPKYGRFPDRPLEVPSDLIAPLVAWHARLGVPEIEIQDVEDSEGKPTGRKRVNRIREVSPESL